MRREFQSAKLKDGKRARIGDCVECAGYKNGNKRVVGTVVGFRSGGASGTDVEVNLGPHHTFTCIAASRCQKIKCDES